MKDFKRFYDNDPEPFDYDLFEDEVLDDAELTNKMADFILDLEEDEIPEDLAGDYVEIVEMIAGPEEEDVDEDEDVSEVAPAKKVRRDPVKRRKAAREHRKVRAKKKIEGRRTRKTAKFKRFKKKQKRKGKLGKTATGKRKRTFINK